MKQKHDIVIVGLQPWDIQIGSNCKNMAIELSKSHRILYVNAALDSMSAIKNRNNPNVQKRLAVLKGKSSSFEMVNSNLWVYTPKMLSTSINWLPGFLFDIALKMKNHRFAEAIKDALDALEFKNYILLNDSDMFRSFYLKEYLMPAKSIYYTRDNLMTVPYWKKHGQKYEPLLMKKSDYVLGNSPYLINKAKMHNTNSFYIGQGCDIEAFSNFQKEKPPIELSSMTGKIIGYTGLLTDRRLDVNLIYSVAKIHSDWNVVLIGPEEDSFKNSKLHDLSNIHFLGNRNPDELPNYVSYFDVCINPQVVNELTIANYPRKIDEYLASGKPVVATYTPTMEIFDGIVYMASTSNEFINCIERALKEDSVEMVEIRKSFATSHSWTQCINNLWDAII